MARYKCAVCGYVYDEEKGDPKCGISAGTKFSALLHDWVCPVCGADKDMFEKLGAPITHKVEFESGMTPIGLLMIEHRLIERMIALLKQELDKEASTKHANSVLIDNAIDFFRTYADKTHHGKEEDILFKELSEKQISQDHEKTMNELMSDHAFARQSVANLSKIEEKYKGGDRKSVVDIIKILGDLVALYPAHIEKEDKHFFIPAMKYFNGQEQNDMLQKFLDFDRNMIHEHYKEAIKRIERSL